MSKLEQFKHTILIFMKISNKVKEKIIHLEKEIIKR
jgi:hypothetical protein